MTVERARIGLYAAAAVAVAALISSAFLLTRQGFTVSNAVVAALPPSIVFGFIGLASRYPCRAIPLRKTGFATLAATHLGSAAAAGGLWIVLWKAWLPFTDAGPVDFSLVFVVGALLYCATVTVNYLVLELDASLRYQILAREAELKAFKAQVDPHFLFNSLNAVASLCMSKPAEARAMAQLMADFFRKTLRLGALDRITLAEEIQLVSHYLAIEKVRFGERLAFTMNVDDAASKRAVPPLLLQPLVENSVRHGIASMVEGGTIDLSAMVRDGKLQIRIENPADPDRPNAKGEGIGLQNARGRLSAISDGRASFRTDESDGRFRVEIELP